MITAQSFMGDQRPVYPIKIWKSFFFWLWLYYSIISLECFKTRNTPNFYFKKPYVNYFVNLKKKNCSLHWVQGRSSILESNEENRWRHVYMALSFSSPPPSSSRREWLVVSEKLLCCCFSSKAHQSPGSCSVESGSCHGVWYLRLPHSTFPELTNSHWTRVSSLHSLPQRAANASHELVCQNSKAFGEHSSFHRETSVCCGSHLNQKDDKRRTKKAKLL